jgi:hypothetical protein
VDIIERPQISVVAVEHANGVVNPALRSVHARLPVSTCCVLAPVSVVTGVWVNLT